MFENITEICDTNPSLLDISESNEFYFKKGQDALTKWVNMVLTEEQKDIIIQLSADFDAFKSINPNNLEIYPIQQLLFEVISYCDVNANDKARYNLYDDNRTIAKAGVRMGSWIKSLIEYKFNPQNVTGSTRNAFDYFVEPENNSTVLSENHRKEIITFYLKKEYTPNSFTDDLKEIFSGYNLIVLNSDNYTHYLSRLIYFYDHEWKPKANFSFKLLVERLSIHFKNNNIELKVLEWQARQKYVWIADRQEIIGGYIAHYEVSSRIKGGRNIYVDIHFESKIKSEKEMFFNSIKVLPQNLEWIDWQSCKSIGYNEVFTLDDDDIIEKVTSALEYMEENIGDEIRQIINNLPPGDTNNNTSHDSSNEMKNSLNQILYGPPGTGKTYNTINKALKIINDAEVQTLEDWNDRATVKALFDKKVKDGQIVFTTFHQNMSYEDVIEGIKPITIDGEVTYEIIRGIFKKLCDDAKKKEIKSNNFSDAYKLLLAAIEKSSGNKMILETLVHSKEFTIYKNSQGNIKFHANTEKAYPGVIKKEILEHYLKTGETLDWPSYTKSLSKFIIDNYGYTQSEEPVNKKFVIIIDEINRGNVSKIFGELITLIEESKRTGKSEAISAKLPYSKEEFSVPENVYLLGTMNTADRSIESLDTALRRRFDFVEMMPKYDLFKKNDMNYFLNGMFAFDILKTINDRLEVLLGRDHLIGHSFFILDENESIESKVKSAFYKNIIPLLQEYFYGDYNKIGLVLGSGFVHKNEVAKANKLFADNSEFSGDDYVNNTYTFEIIDYSNTKIYPTNKEFNTALDILMNKTKASETDA